MVQESQKRAARKWDSDHMATIGCKVKKEQAEAIKNHASQMNETVNAFLRRAALETMERDNGCISPSPVPQASAVAVSGQCPQPLTDTARKAAVEASEASGEELPVFVERAIITQAKRDKLGRILGKTTKEAGE